jgi:hypothetical protein
MNLTISSMPKKSLASIFGVLFALVVSPILAQQEKQTLPIVSSAAVPSYPPTARVAGIQGEVRVLVGTDGKTVSTIRPESGHPILIEAAQDNIRTWKFAEHQPTNFVVTFRYRIEGEAVCRMDNGTVILHLPSDIQITVKGILTCDPKK